MRRIYRNGLALVVGVLLGAAVTYASAASVAVKPPSGITGNPASSTGWSSAANFVGTFNAAAFNSGFTTNVGGKAVTMPASMRIAANAGQFAANAVRMNAAGLIGTAVAAWLLPYGIEWLDGLWQKRKDPDPSLTIYCWGDQSNHCYGTSAAAAWSALWGPQGFIMGDMVSQTDSLVTYKAMKAGTGYDWHLSVWRYVKCANGTVWTGSGCVVPAPSYQPATPANWDAVTGISDAAAGELAQKGVAIPLDPPVFSPKYVDEPISAPYVDPVTGNKYQDTARVTPNANGQTADVQVTRQEVDDAGQPVDDPVTGEDVKPEEQKDNCRANPDSSACKPLDDVPDSELEKKENSFSLNPVSGFGADSASCPVPQTLFTRGGQAITWDWGKFCQFAQGMRPLIIGFAWLAAIAMVVAVGRRNS